MGRLVIGLAARYAARRRWMSQEALAELSGVSRNWVSMFELDKGNPTQETLRKVFGALGYDVELRIARILRE